MSRVKNITITKYTKELSTTNKAVIMFLGFVFLISVFYFSSLSLPTVFAEGLSLKVAPSVLQINALPSSTVDAPFTVENTSNDSINLHIGYKIINKELSQEGIITFLNDGESFPGLDKNFINKVQIIDESNQTLNSLQLGPKQQKKLKVRIALPNNERPSDYYFSIIMLHDNSNIVDPNGNYINKKDQISSSTLQGGVALNVLLAVGALDAPQAMVYDFSTPFYEEKGPVPITVKVKNYGMHYISPRGQVIIKNFLGQKVGTLDIPPTTILAGTTRTLVDNLQLASSSNGQPKIVWNDKFLFGIYNVTLKLAMSNDGPFYTKTIQFAAFPIQFSISLVLLILLIIIVYLRLKKRYKFRK